MLLRRWRLGCTPDRFNAEKVLPSTTHKNGAAERLSVWRLSCAPVSYQAYIWFKIRKSCKSSDCWMGSSRRLPPSWPRIGRSTCPTCRKSSPIGSQQPMRLHFFQERFALQPPSSVGRGLLPTLPRPCYPSRVLRFDRARSSLGCRRSRQNQLKAGHGPALPRAHSESEVVSAFACSELLDGVCYGVPEVRDCPRGSGA